MLKQQENLREFAVKIRWGEGTVWAGWGGASCAPGFLEVPAELAGEMSGVGDVHISIERVRPAESVAVQAVSESDWALVNANAEYFEKHFIAQVTHSPLRTVHCASLCITVHHCASLCTVHHGCIAGAYTYRLA